MQISSILRGHSDPAALEKREQANRPLTQPSILSAQTSGPTAVEASSSLAKIVSRYDVTDISPREFSQMVQKLYEAQLISLDELQQLAAIRHDLDVDELDVDLEEAVADKIDRNERRYPADKARGRALKYDELESEG